MIESLRIIGSDAQAMGGEEKDKVPKVMSKGTLRDIITTTGKELGESLQDHEIEEIYGDCQNLIFQDDIVIEDFAKFLMTH